MCIRDRLPAGAIAGWGLHPLESAAFSRRTPRADILGYKITIGFSLLHHLPAIGVKRIINYPFGGIHRMVVFVAEVAKAFGYGFEPWPFGLMIECIVGVRTVDNFSKQHERCIVCKLVLV